MVFPIELYGVLLWIGKKENGKALGGYNTLPLFI